LTDGLFVRTDGTRLYYSIGKLSHLNGPAVEKQSGNKEWWMNGSRHRADGPAIEEHNGNRE
jgi:hypothetical protein